jgi:DNA-binding NarL/FixJ family response regulator
MGAPPADPGYTDSITRGTVVGRTADRGGKSNAARVPFVRPRMPRSSCEVLMAGTPQIGKKPNQIRCVVVEDQVMFLELLTTLLVARPGLHMEATARTVAEGTTACRLRRPDLLLLDLALPDGNGLQVAKVFLESRPDGEVIVLSGHSTDFVCPDWLSSRLRAVISKNDTFDALRRELDELLGVMQNSTDEHRPSARDRLLTKRESEVYALIGEGFTSAQIADRLGLSEHTVHTHRKRIAAKLGTQGDELTRRAIAHRTVLSEP